MSTHITTHDINRQLINENFISLYNVQITCLNLDIIGRYNFNKGGDSFIRIEQLNNFNPNDITDIELLSFHYPYICGFGHCMYGMLTCYSNYLTFYKSRLTKHYSILHFTNNDHISQLNKLYSEMESTELLTLTLGQIIKIRKVTFFKPYWSPIQRCNIAIVTIKKYIQKNYTDILTKCKDKNIAICKTTIVKKLDNKFNPHGNLDYYKLQGLLNQFDIQLLNHADMNVKEIIASIMSCELLVTNWGATSAWHSFLTNDQKCYCIVPKSYWSETINKQWLCFNNELYNNYVISSKSVHNNLYPHDIAHIKTELENITST